MVGESVIEEHKRIVALNERLLEQESYGERVFAAISDQVDDYEEPLRRGAVRNARRVLDAIKGDDRTARALLSLVADIRVGEFFRVQRLVKEQAAERARVGRMNLEGRAALLIAIRRVIEGTEGQPPKHPFKHRRSLAYAKLIRDDVGKELEALRVKYPGLAPTPVPAAATLKKRIAEVLDEAEDGESLIPEA
jgi:hypothetical protein